MTIARMPSRSRALVVTGLALVILPAVLWAVTGREGYTRWPDSRLASADAPPSTDQLDLFEDIGLTTRAEVHAQPTIESRFALGLLPGGFTPKYLASVATVSFIGTGMLIVGTYSAMRTSKRLHCCTHTKEFHP